ncbi:Heavy metal-associated domain, HMA [Cynara cardunculus var. scolymus]|uniref:Heavy metal-associated domain, HMA n=1 Tax=Cynara cardunculus var. scolymus TaxID=59895 RepID=A0A118K3W9_CYNCS|nr:Heavy metal-associated domain, HMA [Cynara cardunculus var. scolymus]
MHIYIYIYIYILLSSTISLMTKMMLISSIEEISSIVLDPAKNTATIIGEADPAAIIKRVRKFKKSARLISVGPAKEEKKDEKKEEKKDGVVPSIPRTCHRCDVWYVVQQDYVSPCHIL